MTVKNPSIAVIGCGYWGKNIVRNFSILNELRMVCDPFPANAKAMSEQFDVPAVDFEAILNDPMVKGVAIAAPAPLHFDLASKVIMSGKHVFVEKPITLEIEEAKELIRLAKEHDRLLMVGHLLNYHPAFLKVCSLVQSGEIGAVQRIYSNRLSFGKVRTEENVLWSFAPHDISMILRLAGGVAPVDVSAHGGSYVSAGIDDFATVNMAFENGVTAHIFVSWLHPFKEQRLVVTGSKGAIVFDDTVGHADKVKLYRSSAVIENGQPKLEKSEAIVVEYEQGEPLRNECQAFLDGMMDRANVYTDGAEGLRVLDVLSRAETSMRMHSKLK